MNKRLSVKVLWVASCIWKKSDIPAKTEGQTRRRDAHEYVLFYSPQLRIVQIAAVVRSSSDRQALTRLKYYKGRDPNDSRPRGPGLHRWHLPAHGRIVLTFRCTTIVAYRTERSSSPARRKHGNGPKIEAGSFGRTARYW